MSRQSVSVALRDHSKRIVSTAVVLALLYLGRSILIPVTFALMLSLVLAPFVRILRLIGVGRAASVFAAVFALVLSCATIAGVLGSQVLRVATDLPEYQATVERKLETLDGLIRGRLPLVTRDASRLGAAGEPSIASADRAADTARLGPTPVPNAVAPMRLPIASDPLQLFRTLVKSVWGPLQAIGIVLIVLIFALLEHEQLRDRFIRMVGAADIRASTLALTDAGQRLSRYFVAQFAVNLAVGSAIWASMALLHVPQAMLLGALTAVMRFVPYVGVGVAALAAAALGFAADPGWSMSLGAIGAFILLDIIVGQLLEPNLYGHATGLSPLSVVIAALFWSAIWGPAGLILSTPLTLCLLVAGRHVKALGALELLLGDVQTLSLPQKFYQRALAGDAHEILADARIFLKRASLAAYCDRVLLPALHLARLDTDSETSGRDHHVRTRRVIVEVVASLCDSEIRLPRRHSGGSVFEEMSAGRWLRQQRERALGRWQGSVGVPPGSVVICFGLSSPADDLAAELLVRLLRINGVDARHFSPADISAGLPRGADPHGVYVSCLVSAFPSPERDRAHAIDAQIRDLFPYAAVLRVFCPGANTPTDVSDATDTANHEAGSLVQAIEFCMPRQKAYAESGRSQGNIRAARLMISGTSPNVRTEACQGLLFHAKSCVGYRPPGQV